MFSALDSDQAAHLGKRICDKTQTNHLTEQNQTSQVTENQLEKKKTVRDPSEDSISFFSFFLTADET